MEDVLQLPAQLGGPLFVNEALWRHYHQRRREVIAEWVGPEAWSGPFEVLDAGFIGVKAGHAQLLDEVRLLAKTMPGNFLIPV